MLLARARRYPSVVGRLPHRRWLTAFSKPLAFSIDQKEVLAHEQSMIVTGVPGSGKTLLIAAKAIHLIKEDGVRPSSILVLSGTKGSGASIQHLIDRTTRFQAGNTVRVTQPGQLAFNLTKMVHPGIAVPTRERLLRVLRPTLKLSSEKTLVEMAKLFSALERNEVTVDRVAQLESADSPLPEQYRQYLRAVEQEKIQIFHPRAIEIITNREELMAPFQYLLIDDFQAFNSNHFGIVRALVSRCPEATVIAAGDENQNMNFGMRKEAATSVEALQQIIPDATHKHLPNSYRVPGKVLAAAQSVIDGNKFWLNPDATEGPLQVKTFERQQEGILQEVRRRIDEDGVCPSELMILTRTNQAAADFVEALRERGLKSRHLSRTKLFDRPYLNFFVSFLQAVSGDCHDRAFWDLLLPPSPLALPKEARARLSEMRLGDPVANGSIEKLLGSLSAGSEAGAEQAATVLAAINKGRSMLHEGQSALQILSGFARDLSWQEIMHQQLGNSVDEEERCMQAFATVISQLESTAGTTDAREIIPLLHNARVENILFRPVDPYHQQTADGVTACTLGLAKQQGLTAKHVFIPSFTQRHFPFRFSRPVSTGASQALLDVAFATKSDHLRTEANALFTTMTRASESVTFVRPKSGTLSDYAVLFAESSTGEKENKNVVMQLAVQKRQALIASASTQTEGALFADGFSYPFQLDSKKSRGSESDRLIVSYSSMKAFYECPLKYYFQFHNRYWRLVMNRQTSSKKAILGKVMHDAVEAVTNLKQEGVEVVAAPAAPIHSTEDESSEEVVQKLEDMSLGELLNELEDDDVIEPEGPEGASAVLGIAAKQQAPLQLSPEQSFKRKQSQSPKPTAVKKEVAIGKSPAKTSLKIPAAKGPTTSSAAAPSKDHAEKPPQLLSSPQDTIKDEDRPAVLSGIAAASLGDSNHPALLAMTNEQLTHAVGMVIETGLWKEAILWRTLQQVLALKMKEGRSRQAKAELHHRTAQMLSRIAQEETGATRVDSEVNLRAKVGDVLLVGKIDQILHSDDGAIIREFKLTDLGLRGGVEQMYIYLFLYELATGTKPLYGIVEVLETGQQVKVMPNEKTNEEVQALVSGTEKAVRSDGFLATPSSFGCSRCPLAGQCPKTPYKL